jgi:glutaredoxin 3
MAAVRVYSTNHCGYCRRAESLLQRKGVAFERIDVSGDRPMRRWLMDTTGRRTVPQIFINDASIGGYDELARLESRGVLDRLLAGE